MEESLTIFIAIGATFYFLPFCIGWMRGHPNKVGIFLVNLLFGWTGLGWLGIFIYAALSSTSGKDDYKNF